MATTKFTSNLSKVSTNQDKYIVTDESGNTLYTTPTLSEEISKAVSNKQPIYQTSSGELTTQLSSGVSMNTDTGKITVSAPKAVMETSAFKNYFGDGTLLKSYSAVYKSNADYKVPYSATGKEEDKQEITIPELVSKWDEALKEMTDDYLISERDKQILAEKKNPGAANFSTEQTNIATSAPIIRGDTKPSGTARLVIPNSFFSLQLPSGFSTASIRELSSFAETNGASSVQRDDFMSNWYNLDHLSRDDMVTIAGALQTWLDYGNWDKDSDTYETDEGTAYNNMGLTEMAKTLAFQEFVLNEDPTGNFFQKTGTTLEAAGVKFAMGASKAATGTLSIFETTAGFLTNNLDNWTVVSGKNQELKIADEYYSEAVGLCNDAALAVGNIAEVGGYIAGSWATGKIMSYAGAGVGNVVGKVADKISAVATGTETAANVTALSTAQAVAVGNFVRAGSVGSELVGAATELGNVTSLLSQTTALAKGASFVVSLYNATGKIGQVFSWASDISQQIKNTPLVGTALEFLTDTIRDAAMTDPEAVRTILKDVRNGNVSQKDLDYAKQQFIENAKAWGVFRGAGVALKISGKTTLGKALNLKTSQWLAGIDAWVGDKDEALKAKIFGKSTIDKLSDHLDDLTEGSAAYRRVYNKLQQVEANAILRRMKSTFASGDWDDTLRAIEKRYGKEVGKDLTGLKKWIAEAAAVQNNIRAWNNAIDHMKSYVTKKTLEMADPNQQYFTGMTNRRLTEWDTRLSAAESSVGGLTYDAEHTMMSVESSNYLGLTVAIEHAERVADMPDAPGAAAAARELPKMQARLDEISDSLPTGLKSVLDEGLPLYRQEYAALNEYATAYGYVNIISREAVNDLDLWEDGYVRTQRIIDDTGYRLATETGERVGRTSTSEYGYMFDAGRDYKDFEQTRQQYRNQIAQAAYSKELQQTYLLDGNATQKVVISAEQTEYVRKMEAAKAHFYTDVANSATDVKVDLNVSSKKTRVKRISDSVATQTISGIDYTTGHEIMTGMGYSGGSLTSGYAGLELSAYTPKQKQNMWDDFYDELNDEARSYLERKGITNIEQLQDAIKSGSDFDTGLTQAFLKGDSDFRQSDTLRVLVDNNNANRTALAGVSAASTTKITLRHYEGTLNNSVSNTVNGVVDWSESYIDSFVSQVTDKWSVKEVGENLAVDMGGVDSGIVTQHAALAALQGKSKKEAYGMLDASLKKEFAGVKMTDADREKIYDEMHKLFDNILDSRIRTLEAQILEGGADYVERANIFKKVDELNDEIISTRRAIKAGVQSKSAPQVDIIEALDENGATVFYRVDPALAGLYNRRRNLSKEEANFWAQTNYALSKMFRFGTTTMNLVSMGNQLAKDFGHASLVGGMYDTFKNNSDAFRDVFGDDVIDQLQQFDDYEYRQIVATADAQGISVQQALLNREQSRALNIAGESSEYKAFQEFQKTLREGRDGKTKVIDRINDKVSEIEQSIDEKTNGWRENYLRKNVYMSNLNRSLADGNSIQQARVVAEFAERNATTNFGRTLYHLQSISESTPYFAAAINGTKSFWRMFELDPVAITGRMMGGLIMPMMYLTGQNLADETNREVYNNIPEYTKEGNFVYVSNGQIFTIPIPEELTSIVAPFRHFVEHIHGTDQYSFWQLLSNDVLGLSPVDLQGFSDVDMDRMDGDITLGKLAGRGFARVFSQVAPVPFKTAYMGFFQVDPYTGKKITTTKNYYYDEETSSYQVMDYQQNQFALSTARLFGSDNPTLIEKITSSVIGQSTTDIAGFLWGLGTLVGDASMTDEELAAEDRSRYTPEKYGAELAETLVSRVAKPFTEDSYNQVNAAWRREVSVLQSVKDDILNDQKVQNLNSQIQQATDPQKRKALIAQRQNYYDKFAERVKTAVNQLTNEYGGTLDRYKYAAVIALLNFDSNSGWASGSTYSTDLTSDLFYDGRTQAIQTLEKMGITGAKDTSIFGYLYTDRYGETKMKYNLPTAMLDAQNAWYSASSQNLANITALLENGSNSIKSQRSAMYAELKAVDAKDYDKKDDIRDAWNQKVLAAIMPYIQNMTPDAILSDDVVKYLEGYIQVPSYWEKVNNRYISSGYNVETGTYKLDKNMAFIESYLRKNLEED